jgi:hypothetical protein
MPDLSATSCGAKFLTQFSPVRREVLQHPLCPGCFMPLELARADEADVEKFEP